MLAMAEKKTQVFRGIDTLLSLQGAALKQGRRIQEADLGFIRKAALVTENGKIVWIGPQKDLPKNFARKSDEISLDVATVMPGFVECHTHSLFAGTRSAEFELRLQGVSYQEIAKKGGGILSTMRETRKMSAGQLQQLTEMRVQKFIRQGVTTLEIKSGYALNHKDELKSLAVIRNLKSIRVVPTFLGAHSVPPEFASASLYLEHLEKLLPKVRKLTNRLDIWIEAGTFEKDLSRAYLKKAKELGFQIVVHADQLTLSGGTELAVDLQAVSADHVIQLKTAQIQKLARSATTAVLLPMADLYMKCAYPPARKLIDAGARIALATDFNPGTCPSQDISLVGLLARLEMKMSLPEVIAAYTVGAAHALGLQDQIGSLEPEKYADFIGSDQEWTSLFYSAGTAFPGQVYSSGNLFVFEQE
jgi:imidazolonepropionase